MDLSIDIETYSSVDLKKAGLYKYVQSDDFEILLFAYAYDDQNVTVIDLAAGEKIPYFVVMDLHRPEIRKTAWNAAFEYYCLSKFFDTRLEQWYCTMVHSLYCGYPAGLAAAGAAMNLPQDKKKMTIGQALIRYFCIPCARSKRNGGRTRNYYYHDTAKWRNFKEYCRQDVVTERELKNRLSQYPLPEAEHQLWIVDMLINIRGVRVDLQMIDGALTINDQITNELKGKAKRITGLDNPNSVAQLKKWVENNADLEVESLNKQTVAEILVDLDDDAAVKQMLKIRQELSKTSVKKYAAMNTAVCSDGRLRGLLQFYGANRTGRWAGRLVQIHNLPRNYLETLSLARDLVKKKSINSLKVIYGNVPDTLSQLIRTTFIPADGHDFVAIDFSAIEARVIAWLAGEQWRLDVFNTHGRIYEASASAMFGVPIEKISKGNPEYELRAKGKVAELALGYQGASGALIQMGALRMGLKEEDLPDIVSRWRGSNKRIVDLWYSVQGYAADCIATGRTAVLPSGVMFTRDSNYLFVTLPSGRQLFYCSPWIETEGHRKKIWFNGLNQTTKKWEAIQTYGGKLTENIVQAIARDCLAYAIMNLHNAGYKINFHVHDEIVMEVPTGSPQILDTITEIMCQVPPWAAGLPLNADGFIGNYYKKE